MFNSDDLTLSQFQDAWDPGGTNGTNFIGVTSWPGFGNSGDVVALWDDIADYNSETTPGDTQDNAVAALMYLADNIDWPDSNNSSSVNLRNLANDTTNGNSWDLSTVGDSIGSFQISVDTVLHPGGDVASPGTFVATASSDADDDGDFDGADFLRLQRVIPATIPQWEIDYGGGPLVSGVGAVPEPSSLVLFGLAVAPLAWRRRLG